MTDRDRKILEDMILALEYSKTVIDNAISIVVRVSKTLRSDGGFFSLGDMSLDRKAIKAELMANGLAEAVSALRGRISELKLLDALEGGNHV